MARHPELPERDRKILGTLVQAYIDHGEPISSLWLASREYLRRHNGCDNATKDLQKHGPDRLGSLHTEYELEASALLGMRHAADAYKQDRPTAT